MNHANKALISTEEIDDIIILINEKYDELDEVNEQLSKMKQQNLLHKMRRTKSKTAGFCSQCGEKLCTKYLRMIHLCSTRQVAAADVMQRLNHSNKSKHNKNNRHRSKQKNKTRIHKHNWIPIHVKRGEYPLFFILFSRVTMAKIGCLWHKRDNAII